MPRKALKAVAAAAVAVVFINTFLSFISLPEDPSYEYHYDHEQYSRRLAGKTRVHTPRERVINELVKQGIRPDNPNFRRLLKVRLKRLEERSGKAASQRQMLRGLKNNKNIWFRRDANRQAEIQQELAQVRDLKLNNPAQKRMLKSDSEPLTICGRPTMVNTPSDLALPQYLEDDNKCPGENSNKLLLLQGQPGTPIYGRMGNNLVEFLHALQYARDNDVKLGIMEKSWASELLHNMFASVKENEEAFCFKIFHSQDEVQGYDLVFSSFVDNVAFTKQLFMYDSKRSLVDYIGHQTQYIQTLFRNYNTGQGTTASGEPVRDMCSGIKALFGDQKNAIYSVIHQRSLEGAGNVLMARVSRFSGCDPQAALHMAPDYVKSILKPLGLLDYPIVLITDGQDFSVLQRLLNDPDIAPKLRLVPEEATWVGGDITLAVMANVFIGNPASTFSGFIAKSRLALGFGQSYLFRAKNEDGEWVDTCGDTCIFDRGVVMAMS